MKVETYRRIKLSLVVIPLSMFGSPIDKNHMSLNVYALFYVQVNGLAIDEDLTRPYRKC